MLWIHLNLKCQAHNMLFHETSKIAFNRMDEQKAILWATIGNNDGEIVFHEVN